jgi:hypothetical protein
VPQYSRWKVSYPSILYATVLAEEFTVLSKYHSLCQKDSRILQNPKLVGLKMLDVAAHGCQAVGNGHGECNQPKRLQLTVYIFFFNSMPPMGDCWWGGELGLPIGQEMSKTFISPAPLIFVVSLSTPLGSSHPLFCSKPGWLLLRLGWSLERQSTPLGPNRNLVFRLELIRPLRWNGVT